jgi:hypothetical protein
MRLLLTLLLETLILIKPPFIEKQIQNLQPRSIHSQTDLKLRDKSAIFNRYSTIPKQGTVSAWLLLVDFLVGFD